MLSFIVVRVAAHVDLIAHQYQMSELQKGAESKMKYHFAFSPFVYADYLFLY